MSNTKSVQQVLAPPPPHMVGDGFRVHNFFPSGYDTGLYRMSPFFLLDYGSKVEFPPSDKPRGVGVHPHRGFETVTIAFKGKVAHHDSAGNSGIIGEGDVQWMTAGSGILHKEYHETEYSKKGGPFQMVQLWVNLPAKDKMTPPKYQAIEHDQMGKYLLPDGGGVVEVIAGEYEGVNGPATTFTPIHAYVGRLNAGASLPISLPEKYNTGLLVTEGNLRINGTDDVATDHFAAAQRRAYP
jgi:quercetin 2,3-dioxygenase